MNNASIICCLMNGQNCTAVISKMSVSGAGYLIKHPTGLSVHVSSHRLFWGDSDNSGSGGVIVVSALDGKNLHVLEQ